MTTSRRSFLTGLVSFVAAPAIIKVADIMPIKPERITYLDIEATSYGAPRYGTVTGRFFEARPNFIEWARRPVIYAAMIEDGVATPPRPFLRSLDLGDIEERLIAHLAEEFKK